MQSLSSERSRPINNRLTGVELRIMRLVVAGFLAAEIYDITGRTRGSVDKYMLQMRRRFGAKNTAHLVAILMRQGLIS